MSGQGEMVDEGAEGLGETRLFFGNKLSGKHLCVCSHIFPVFNTAIEDGFKYNKKNTFAFIMTRVGDI